MNAEPEAILVCKCDTPCVKHTKKLVKFCAVCGCKWSPQQGSHWPPESPSKKLMTPNVKVGRNDICPCGSMKKFKKCCINALRLTPTQPTADKIAEQVAAAVIGGNRASKSAIEYNRATGKELDA